MNIFIPGKKKTTKNIFIYFSEPVLLVSVLLLECRLCLLLPPWMKLNVITASDRSKGQTLMLVCVLCCIVPQCKWGETKSHSGDPAGGSSHGGIFVCTSNNARTKTPVCAPLVSVQNWKFNCLLASSSSARLYKSAAGIHKS